MNSVTFKPVVSTPGPTLYNQHSGIIVDKFKSLLEIIGFVGKQHSDQFSADHIFNVDHVLQENGSFQKSHTFFKEGGKSKNITSEEMAARFMDLEYADRKSIMPEKNGPADAIFQCGVEASMHHRFRSFAESLTEGCTYNTIHFIAKDLQAKEEAEKLINETYGSLLKGIKINFVVVDTELNILEEGLSKLKSSPLLGENYVLITNPTFAEKVRMTALNILKEKTCNGVAASLEYNTWQDAMKAHGYSDSISFAAQELNFMARKAHTEAEQYKKNLEAMKLQGNDTSATLVH